MNFKVRWCSLCNSAMADGTLTVYDHQLEELIPLPACQSCVDKLEMEKQ